MLFNSLEFLLFFPIVTGLYFLSPHKYRWLLLLIASCWFYMAFVPVYIVILGATIVIDYFAGLYIAKQSGRKRKLALTVSIVANVGVLAFFKYWNFLNANLTEFLGFFDSENPVPYLDILLPVGLSFHTFQAMSYTIEVYRGNQQPEKHFGIYALYVMFYPQLVAGPIERPQNMIHQFHEKHHFDYAKAVSGLRLILWGFFKKMVIADRLAVFVGSVFDDPTHHHGLSVLLAGYLFAIQIYCDFSGYTDIAIGTARVMGFDLMRNFNLPYFATSLREFWTRWHISLSAWFRDYLYIPLGGNRVSQSRWMANLLIVFIISGLWHGANWTFIIWGALHGTYLVLEILIGKIGPIKAFVKTTAGKFTAWMITLHLVVFAWIFFRAASTKDAFTLIRNIFTDGPDFAFSTDDKVALLFGIFFAGILFLVEYLTRKKTIETVVADLPLSARWSLYICFSLAIMWFGVYTQNQFIYFQF